MIFTNTFFLIHFSLLHSRRMSALCGRCRRKRAFVETSRKKTRNGAYLVFGKCSSCGANVSTFVSAKKQKGGKFRKSIYHDILLRSPFPEGPLNRY